MRRMEEDRLCQLRNLAAQYHQIMSENKMLNELRNIRQQLDNRVAVLEKWRWIIVGGSIIVGLMISNPDSMLFKLIG